MAKPITRTLHDMSYVPPPSDGPPPAGDGRALAMLNYGLMFCSIFFAGVPSLIAVAIAYSQKTRAAPWLRTHFKCQIALFWATFVLALAAGAMGLTGLFMALGELLVAGGRSWEAGWRIWEWRVNGAAIALMVGGVLVAALDAALLMINSAIGFIRLASAPPLGKSAA